MGNLDSTIAFSKKDITSVVVTFGDASTLTLSLLESTIAWQRSGATYAEVTENGFHLGTPQTRITGDGTIAITLDVKIASWKGSSNVHPYEAFTLTGTASGLGTVGAGDKKQIKLTVTYNSTTAGGGSQTVAFNYCVPDMVDIKDSNGLIVGTITLTDLENEPTIA